jgi:hypothetical protein
MNATEHSALDARRDVFRIEAPFLYLFYWSETALLRRGNQVPK